MILFLMTSISLKLRTPQVDAGFAVYFTALYVTLATVEIRYFLTGFKN